MNDKITSADAGFRPLAERQAEADAAIIAKMGEKDASMIMKGVANDAIKWKVLAVLLGREAWEKFWSVYRDSVERAADETLSEVEGGKTRRPSAFDGL